MITNKAVVQILRNEAKEEGFKIFNNIHGEILLNDNLPIKQSSGSVYGILAISDTPLNGKVKPINGYPNIYPVYWGKDISPVSRLKAHVQNHQTTGNVDLRSITKLNGKKVIFGAVLVERYSEFETHLHNKYPPLRGTSKTGRVSSIIEIMH